MYQPLTNEDRDTLTKAAVILTTKVGPQWLTYGASPDRRLADAVHFLYDVMDYDAADRPEIDADLVIAPDDVKLDYPDVMKIYAYNENCALAGHEVPADKIDRSEDPENAGDWSCYAGTPEDLLSQADSLDSTDPGHANAFRVRVARLIRSEVYRYHPDLEPTAAGPDDAKLDSPADASAHAEWIEDQQVYSCEELSITSEDGDEWLDYDGRLASGDEFEMATILLHGGPRDGTIVA